MTTKTCSKCGINKPLSQFYYHSSRKAYEAACKECYKKQAAETYAKKGKQKK